MASFDRLRQIDGRPARSGRGRVLGLALAGGLAAAILALLLLAQLAGQRESQSGLGQSFLAKTLGAPQTAASLVREPAPKMQLSVGRRGATVARDDARVAIALDGSSGPWTRHRRGASRTTSFGRETIVFRGEYGLEHFVTVERRQGTRRWRWDLAAPGLNPVVAGDGGIDFFRGTATAGLRIEPVAVFDASRRNVTPPAARWQLVRAGVGWALLLELDDSKLPIPYVIDPNISRTAATSAGTSTNGGTNTLTITRPGNVGDILIASINVANNDVVTAPAGWTLVNQQNGGTGMSQSVFWATGAATLGTTFTWTNSAHASGGIAAYADVHPTSPIDASTPNNGNGTTATALSATSNFSTSMVAALYGARVNGTMTQSAGQSLTEAYNVLSSGNPAGQRMRTVGADGQLLGAAGSTSGNKTATVAATADWATHLLLLRREPPDGQGAVASDTADAAALSSGNTIVLTYTAGADGVADGEVRVAVPSGWSAPSSTTTAAGYTETSSGSLSFSGQTIIVSGVDLAPSATLTITYGSTSGGGPGATAPASTGASTWTSQQKGTLGGTLTDITSPSVTVVAANGSGTLTTPTTNVDAASAGNTITFTYTAAAGGMNDGSISIDVPSGWSAPSTSSSAAGYTTATGGTVSVSGQTITVSGVTLAGSATVDVVYGSTSGGGPGATAPASAGAQTWQGKQRSVAAGTLVALASSPSITVDASDGSGTATASPLNVGYASVGNTVTVTYTADVAMTDGAIAVDVPSGWSAPSTTATAAGYSTASTGTISVAGQTITVTGVTLAAAGTLDVVFGSTGGGGPGASAPASAGAQTWVVRQRAGTGGTLTELADSPEVSVNAQPAKPTGLATAPASPANDTSPEVTGTAPGGSTVRLYTTADCTGSVAATGTAAELGGAGITVAVPDNASTSLSARAVDGLGGLSACSDPISYTADSVAPDAPTALATVPSSPASDNDPRVTGAAEAGSTVSLFGTADCTGGAVATGTAAQLGGAGLDPPNVSDDSSTTYTARATDAAGNQSSCSASVTYVEDSTAPTSTLSFPLALPYRNASWADFAGTASDNGGAGLAAVELSIRQVATGDYWDGDSFEPIAEAWQTATGAASWTYGFAAADFPADGDYVVRVRATDGAGNVEATPSSRTFTIDNAAPETTLDTSPPDPSSDTSPTFAFSSSEGGSSYECKLDTGAWEACTSPKTYASVAEGSHAFQVRATDGAGNQDASPATFTWTLDTTAPTSAIAFPAAGSTYGTATWNDVSGTAGDSGGAGLAAVGLSIRQVATGDYWDGDSFEPIAEAWQTATGAASWTYAFAAADFPADGDYTVRVRATDAAGNVETAPSSRTFTIDTTAPATTIDSGPGDPTNNTAASFTFSAGEPATFECRLDAGAWGACASPEDLVGLAQASHTFEVRAIDGVGNVDATPATFTWTVDTTAPGSVLAFPLAQDYNDAAWADFGGTASDAGGSALDRVELSIRGVATGDYWDGDSFEPIAEAWQTATGAASWTYGFAAADFPADGDYVVRVRAWDTAGNAQTPVDRTFTIDNAAPETAIDAAPADPSNATAPSFDFSADEPAATFECKLDAGAWEACTSPKSYAALTQASHTFQARATDPAGNVDPTPATFTWTLDTTAPTTTVSFPASGGSYNAAGWQAPAGTAADTGGAALDRVQVSIRRSASGLYWNGTSFEDAGETWHLAAGTASWSFAFAAAAFPADGDYVVRVRAADTATNQEPATSYTFTFDSTAPETAIDAAPADPSNATAPSFDFSADEPAATFECKLDAGAWEACTSPKSYAALTQASHTFQARATDPAGNVDPTPATFTWTLDTTAPAAAIGFPDDGAFYNAAAWNDFSGTAADTGGASVAGVQISIRRTADGLYWDGSDFADASEHWHDASGTTSWTLAFSADDFNADGDYAIRVRATDTAGNVQAPVSRSFSVDTVAPNTTVDSGPADPTSSTAPTFTFSADEPGSTFECRLDAGSWETCSSPKAYGGVAAGFHTFEARATDAAGNTDATPAPYTWTVDSTEPDSAVSLPLAAAYNDGGWPAFSGTASDAGGAAVGAVDVSIRRVSTGLYWDGSAFAAGTESWHGASGTTSWTLAFAASSFPTDGDYTVGVRATDSAGNVESSPASVTFTIDNAAPDATIDSSPPPVTNQTTADFTFSATEGGSSFDCRVDGGSWASCSSPKSYTGLAQAAHTFDVRATDAAGNAGSPASFGWTIDTTAPASVLVFPTPGAAYNTAGWSDVEGTASDAGGGAVDEVHVSVRQVATGLYWDGDSFAAGSETWLSATGTASWTLAFAAAEFPADGDYVVRIRAVDTAGNVETPASHTLTYDTSAPTTAIDVAPADPTNATDAQFEFSANESGSSFECRLDGGSWTGCSSPKPYTGLAAGAHTFDVRATDAAGNVDATPASHAWTVDVAAPTASVTFPADGGSYNIAGWAEPAGSSSDTGGGAVDRVEVSIRRVADGLYWDGAAFAAATEQWHAATGTASWSLDFAASDLSDEGDYALRARAVDTAGNTGAPSATHTFTVDTQAPVVTIDSAPADPANDADAAFTFSADEPASFECRLDGGTWAACAAPKSYTGLAEGAHTFEVRGTDAASNTGAAAQHAWVVDTIPPLAEIDDPGTYLRGTIVFSASVSDPGGSGVASVAFEKSPAGADTWTSVPSTWVTTAADDGFYDFRVVATDNAGNTSANLPAARVSGIHVDNTPPNAVLDDPGATASGTVTLTHSSTDGGSGIDPAAVQFQYRASGDMTWLDTPAQWETSALAEGKYELRVTLADRSGNSAASPLRTTVVDNTAPAVDFVQPLDGAFVNAADPDPYTLVATATDGGSGMKEVEFFDGATSLGVDTAAPYEAAWDVVADGDVTVRAVARDEAGHESEAQVTFTVDRASPDTSLLTNPGDPSNDTTPEFTFSSTEAGSTFECRVDGGAWAPCATPHTEAPLADGTHTFEVRAVDAAGNADASASGWTWLVDATPPTATMDDPGAYLRGDVVLTSSQSDPGGANASGIASVQFEYSVAGADTWVAASSPWATTSVSDGLYDVRVRVTDNAGNETASAAVTGRRIDNTPPATSIDDPGANLRATVTLGASASDTGSGVAQVTWEYSIDGVSGWTAIPGAVDATEPYAFDFDTTALTDGLYWFRTVATDVAGNVASGTPVGPRRVDNTPPVAIMDDPGPNLRGAVTLSSTADDPGGSGVDTVVYHYTGPETGTTGGVWATDAVADGLYDLHVVVTDVAGNVTASNVVAGRRVDNTPPTTTDNAPAGWQSSAVVVSLNASDGGSGVSNTTFSLDGGAPQSGNSVNVAGDGIHTISYFSTDVAGNVESPKTATVMIDTTPPTAGANDPGNYLRGSVTLSANPSSGGSGDESDVEEVEFQHRRSSDLTWTSLGTAPEAPYEVVWATTAADDGSWDIRFVVRDGAGNETIEQLSSKIVDNTAPTGAVSSPLAGSVVSGGLTLGVTASDDNPLASVEYVVRGSSVGTATSAPFQVGWNSASASDGAAAIYAVITDMAGNSTTTGTVNVTVDNFAPTPTLAAPDPNVSGTVTLSATTDGDTTQVTFERRQGGGWTTIGTATGAPFQVDWNTLSPAVAEGVWELRAVAVDAGGNSGTSGVVTTRVDNTAPTGVVTQPGDGNTVGGSSSPLAASASDGGSGVVSVEWQARQSGVGAYATVASDSSAPYASTWNPGGLASGAYDIVVRVTDLAGNTFTSAPITVNVDSTAPTVTLNLPGGTLAGNVAVGATTGGDAVSVAFGYSPAGAASWSVFASDGTSPYAAALDTTVLPDGLYDFRAVVTDAVGNAGTDVVVGVRVDNYVPVVVGSSPGNGAIVPSADSITLTASEPIAQLTGVELDGNPIAPTSVAGATATFATGPLAEGSHTLTGTVEDGDGKTSTFSITFVIGVPSPPPVEPGGFVVVPHVVPMPTDFRGTIELDETLTLRWTPAVHESGEPLATILYVDGIAVEAFGPDVDEVNLGPFNAGDMRRFSIGAIDAGGAAGPTTGNLRSTSLLRGRALDEATAILVNRGFELGTVTGTGPVVVGPARPLLAAVGSKVDVVLGTPAPPQGQLAVNVVATKTLQLRKTRKFAVRIQTTRAAPVTAALLSPAGVRVYRWRFDVRTGTTIKQLALPRQVNRAGRYRLALTLRSGSQTVKKSVVIRLVAGSVRVASPIEVVLAGGPNVRRELAQRLGRGVTVVSTVGEETWTVTGSAAHNVQIVVVDVDRYGVALVSDLHTVFPSLKIVALTNDPRRLAQAVRRGATVAVPRSTRPKDLARLIALLARRR